MKNKQKTNKHSQRQLWPNGPGIDKELLVDWNEKGPRHRPASVFGIKENIQATNKNEIIKKQNKKKLWKGSGIQNIETKH